MADIGQGEAPERGAGEGLIYAPWERAFERVIRPFEEFIHRQTTSGLLLLASTVIALALANSGVAEFYQHLIHLPAAISVGSWRLELTLHGWVNDGLMAFFFFLVGLELKREFLVGELADPRQAALPILAAIGGMVVPALIYLALNAGTDSVRGWGVPMATDIAFAASALVLLAARVPRGLVTFLIALAIVDDLGAVLVIALFYTDNLSLPWLGIAAVLVAVLALFNRSGIRRVIPYFVVAALLWFALLNSGVHATIAGVLGAFSVPARPKYDPRLFSDQVRSMLGRFDSSYLPGASIMNNEELRAVVQALGSGVVAVQTPLQRLEHIWQMPVAVLVIPVFALFNAGIPLDLAALPGTLSHPVALGVIAGLLLGKFIGVTGVCWLALKTGVAQLPGGTRFGQIAAVSLLAGIGFTMSIFIAELAFANHPDYLIMAKTGVMAASLAGGLAGMTWLWMLGAPRQR
jgi:Na+:H+ antiporter, NhaA family